LSHAKTWRKWRKSKLMSQRDLARAMGVTERTVQNIEAGGNPSYKSQTRFRDLQERHKRNGRI
jgi:transcriptional regulator with XRE-family HTH domain